MSKARMAGVFYLLVFAVGSFALLGGRARSAAALVGGGLYIVVNVLLYQLFKPVSQPVSFIAACVSLAAIVIGSLDLLPVNTLVFFGVYCLLIGYLILRSSFVPRVVGILMLFAGLGWLTFASPALARRLFPFNFAPGLIGEAALTVWLLFSRVGTTSTRPVHT